MMRFLIPLFAALAASSDEHSHSPPAVAHNPGDRYKDNACVQCHRNLAGRSAEIVDLEWANSVHYKNNVACDGCHGGDASVKPEQFPDDDALKQAAHLSRNPEFLVIQAAEGQFVSRARGRGVSYFCGRCHTEIMEKHLGSPHGKFGAPSCLFCHGQGSHTIKESRIDIIDTRPRSQAGRCSPCHQASTMTTVKEIKTILQTTSDLIDSSAAQFRELEEMGYRNLALAEAHHHTAETHSRLRRTFHSFNMRDINDLASSIKAVADQTSYAFKLVVALHKARHTQALVGLASVVFLLVFAGVVIFYKHTFCEDFDRTSAVPDTGD